MATILLIPGLLCDEFVWQPVQTALGGKAHIADLSSQDSLTIMAEDCLARLDGPLVVAGHSMGARVALEMARLAPSRIERLALLDTGIHPLRPGEIEKRRAIIQLAYDQGMDALAEVWLPGMVYEPNQQNQQLMDGLRAMVCAKDADLHARQINALITRPDAEAYISQIEIPTLLMVGRQDAWSPPAQHEQMRDSMLRARLEIIEDAGHFAPLEQPDDLTPKLVSFLLQQPGAADRLA